MFTGLLRRQTREVKQMTNNSVKLLAAVLVGGVIGALAWATLAPTNQPDPPPVREVTETFYANTSGDVVALSNGAEVPFGTFPADIPLFFEPQLKNSLAVILKFRNAQGTVVGFGAELETLPVPGSPPDADWDTDWVLSIPGRGTLYLRQREYPADLMTKIIGPTISSGKDWEGEWQATMTVGPRPDGRGVILGGTGEFDGATGAFIEINSLSKYTVDGQLVGKLQLRIFREVSQ